MTPIRILCSLVLLLAIVQNPVRAQEQRTLKVGLFVPLFLDSAFDESMNYRFGKSFPRQSIAGLEFYEGAEFAMDSLRNETVDVDLHVFDIRSADGSINRVAASAIMDSLDLIIGQVSGSDYLQLAGIARLRQIPFVSATYPNDGGIRSSPQVIMANAKLNTHIQSIYNYILRNMGTQHLVWLRRPGEADNRVEDVFKELNQSPGGGVMKYKQAVLPDNFTAKDILARIDTLRDNVLIAGSLDENFARKILAACSVLPKQYKMTIVGMPTWEGIRELSKSEYRHLPIVYSTTFFNQAKGLSARFEEFYRARTFSKPSDMAFKGFEITYYFVHLLMKYDTAMLSHLNDPSYKLITDYDFQPIRWNKASTEPDYFENKRIYILRRLQNQVTQLQ
jgi:ABC-type branched-subunit amino acid transport system substrate-binding protein